MTPRERAIGEYVLQPPPDRRARLPPLRQTCSTAEVGNAKCATLSRGAPSAVLSLRLFDRSPWYAVAVVSGGVPTSHTGLFRGVEVPQQSTSSFRRIRPRWRDVACSWLTRPALHRQTSRLHCERPPTVPRERVRDFLRSQAERTDRPDARPLHGAELQDRRHDWLCRRHAEQLN